MRHREITAAGAPALPEGMFYRGDETAYGMYRIEIRSPRAYYGTDVVAYAGSWPDETSADIAAVARRAYDRLPKIL